MGKMSDIDLGIQEALMFLNENKEFMTPLQLLTMQRIVSKCIQRIEMRKMRNTLGKTPGTGDTVPTT
jgi:hypothetical protein